MSTKTNNELIMEIIEKMNNNITDGKDPIKMLMLLMEFDLLLENCSNGEKLQSLEKMISVIENIEKEIGIDAGSSERMQQIVDDIKEYECEKCNKSELTVHVNEYKDAFEVVVKDKANIEELEVILNKVANGDIRKGLRSLSLDGGSVFRIERQGKTIFLDLENWKLGEDAIEMLGQGLAYCLSN